MPAKKTEPGARSKKADAGLILSAGLPSTAAAVTLVTAASGGLDFVMSHIFASGLTFGVALIITSGIVSLFATFAAVKLSLLWKLALWPINFLVLVYLSLNAVSNPAAQGSPKGVSHALEQTIIPGGNR